RPGTDLAMLLAIAYVLFDEDLYDHEYVEKWVEPKGFEKFRAYVMGQEDGQPKTPQWAEEITTVPAETIHAFARLYAKSKPVHLQFYYAPAKRHLGEYSATAAMLLQAMTGNLSIPGGCIVQEHLPDEIVEGNIDPDVKASQALKTNQQNKIKSMQEIEEDLIINTLSKTGNNIALTAELLGISKSTLYRRVKKLGINK
ncbi:MAG: molybdopterin-dependent oxidoreductase, partial [Peptococcaceae bacterium]|nr:molybdopterin-dependent oxidoreductase [Peptococcaceae bacterium]